MKNKTLQIIFMLAFPVVLTIGIVLIPVVTDYTDHRLAEQAVGQTIRWFFGHIIAAIAFAISILAVGSLDRHLRNSSRSLPVLTLPLITIGAGFYAAGLGADGIGPLAVQSAGHSPIIFFDGSSLWITGTFAAGTILFGLGLLNMVIGSIQLGVLRGWSRYVSFISVLIFMVAPMILSGWVLYGVAVASFGMFVPLALAIKRD
ncbi:MAG: hypothetical protein Kow00108_16160 [Calditrichia bacterium]